MRGGVDDFGCSYINKNIIGVYGCKMRRFFIDEKLISNDKVIIRGPEAHHIKDVIRLKPGDRFIGLGGKGKIYTLKVLEAKKDIVASVEKVSLRQTAGNRILLACALPKKSKMDDIIAKATELGASDIIPMITKRTIVRSDSVSSNKKQARWERIAIEASKQSGRIVFPKVHGIVDFECALELADKLAYSNKIIPFVGEGLGHISKLSVKECKDIAVFIGPEGDFTRKEIEIAQSCGFKTVSLGPLVLKVDTACFFTLSVISVLSP
jgi:16S rRNA (uracil1498-N3)-methyltransferase